MIPFVVKKLSFTSYKLSILMALLRANDDFTLLDKGIPRYFVWVNLTIGHLEYL